MFPKSIKHVALSSSGIGYVHSTALCSATGNNGNAKNPTAADSAHKIREFGSIHKKKVTIHDDENVKREEIPLHSLLC